MSLTQNNRGVRSAPAQAVAPRTAKRQVNQSAPMSLVLSDPACKYAAALMDPRGLMEPPCVPTFPSQPTYKCQVFARGAGSTGTTGYGYITAGPGPASDQTCATVTAAGSVMGAATALSAVTNLTTAITPNSPFVVAQFGATIATVQWRVVGLAVYVRWSGTELNRGGDVLLVEEPNHGSLAAQTYNSVLNRDETKRIKMDDDWHWVCWSPGTTAELTMATTTAATQPLGILLLAGAGNAQPFEYEIFQWLEFTGSPARGISESDNDPIGFAAISGASNLLGQMDSIIGQKGFQQAIAHVSTYSLSHSDTSGRLAAANPKNHFTGLARAVPLILPFVSPLIKSIMQRKSQQFQRSIMSFLENGGTRR